MSNEVMRPGARLIGRAGRELVGMPPEASAQTSA